MMLTEVVSILVLLIHNATLKPPNGAKMEGHVQDIHFDIPRVTKLNANDIGLSIRP